MFFNDANKLIKTYFSLVITLISFDALSFLNIEALRQVKMVGNFTGSSRVMMTQQKGNVDKVLVSFNSLARYSSNKHTFLGLVDYQYGESFSVIDNRQGHLHLRYSYGFSKSLEFETFHQSEFNKFQSLNARFLFGLGARKGLFRKENLTLYMGAGAFYEKENLEEQENVDNPRGNIYLNLLWSKENRYSISSTLYYQPNLEKVSDNRLKLNIGIETIFENNFTQTIEYSLSRDTRAPEGISSTDSTLSAGIGYRF